MNDFAATPAVQRLPRLGTDGSPSANNQAVGRIDIVQCLLFSHDLLQTIFVMRREQVKQSLAFQNFLANPEGTTRVLATRFLNSFYCSRI